MTNFFTPILAAALMSQFQGGPLQGTVVDDQGKPVVDIQVVFHASAPWGSKLDAIDVRAKRCRRPVPSDDSAATRG
jgi:hypothetical protein